MHVSLGLGKGKGGPLGGGGGGGGGADISKSLLIRACSYMVVLCFFRTGGLLLTELRTQG